MPRRLHRDLGAVSAGRETSGTGKLLQQENLQDTQRSSVSKRKQTTEMFWQVEFRDLRKIPCNAAPPSEQAPSLLSPSQASALRAGGPRCAAPPVKAELQQSRGAALQPQAHFPLQSTGLGAAAQHWGLWEGAQLAQGDAVPSAWLWAMLSMQPEKELYLLSLSPMPSLGNLEVSQISSQGGSFN